MARTMAMAGASAHDSQRRWDAVAAYVAEHGGTSSDELKAIVNGIASAGSTPLVVAET